MKIDDSKGWTEAIVVETCSTGEFLKFAGLLQIGLEVSFQNNVQDLDSFYLDFAYNKRELTLHYNTYTGVSIFPKALTNAVYLDNQAVLDLTKTFADIFNKSESAGNFVCRYFEPEPIQWGFRDDPYLWRDMKLKTSSTKIPSTSNEFKILLLALFKELTGEEPEKGKAILVKKYETIGMSAGIVSSDFWLDEGFSMLIKRYTDNKLNRIQN